MNEYILKIGGRIMKKMLLLSVIFVLGMTSGASAVPIDILNNGDTGTITGSTGGTALLYGSMLGSGIGSSKAFLILGQSGGSGPEKGYNTTGTVEFETKAAGTTAMPLTDLAKVDIGGTNYYEFGLSNNQTGGSSTVSIEEIQLFQAGSSGLDSYVEGTRVLTGATEIFDWMAPADGYIELEDINSGASSLDLLMYIPESAFTTDTFVYLFASMGINEVANDGEERWVNAKGGDPFCIDDENIPCEPVNGKGGGLLGLALFSRRRFRK
jgi:hypothetical protein